MCWGNTSPDLRGAAAGTKLAVPAQVAGLDTGIVAVSTGNYHSCAISIAGRIWCWGQNYQGQIGNGTKTYTATPSSSVQVRIPFARSISAGPGSPGGTCAVDRDGAVWCWGTNEYGQLGTGIGGGDVTRAERVPGLDSGYVAVATGGGHVCVLNSSGGVKCWGANHYGTVGSGSAELIVTEPEQVIGLESGVTAIAAGIRHTCALTKEGEVKCWGGNAYGKLGDGTNEDRHTPVTVQGLELGVVAVSAGGSHTCAIEKSGNLKCWGYNYYGQIGDGTKVNRLTPQSVLDLEQGVVAVSAGFNHTCAMTPANKPMCWGRNNNYQVTYKYDFQPSSPVAVADYP
ncbi:MAG: hypothetical protein FWD57_14365 [Polyangiaceae bacterium]|nr:hypothetical protein [Polyangiaceae bacterium]